MIRYYYSIAENRDLVYGDFDPDKVAAMLLRGFRQFPIMLGNRQISMLMGMATVVPDGKPNPFNQLINMTNSGPVVVDHNEGRLVVTGTRQQLPVPDEYSDQFGVVMGEAFGELPVMLNKDHEPVLRGMAHMVRPGVTNPFLILNSIVRHHAVIVDYHRVNAPGGEPDEGEEPIL
jgi:hypothetical protein